MEPSAANLDDGACDSAGNKNPPAATEGRLTVRRKQLLTWLLSHDGHRMVVNLMHASSLL